MKIKNFLWGFDSQSRCYYPKAWESLCEPKEGGGLGLRKIEDLKIVLW